MSPPTDIDGIRELAQRYSNWNRWGAQDQIGTLNHITGEEVRQAAALIRRGQRFSLSIPLDASGPQNGVGRRFNPIHLMIRDGADVLAGTAVRDFYGGHDRHIRGTDDIVIMPLQCGTQWDALAHIVFDDRIYNGYSAAEVTSAGARKNDIDQLRSAVSGRGVLLDVGKVVGDGTLPPGHAITYSELTMAAEAHGVEVRKGDIVLIRTGHMANVRQRGDWGDYSGGPAPGLGLSTARWIHERSVAAVGVDTWAAEVIPCQTTDVYLPLHIVLIAHMGLTLGEIFDLDELAADCASDGVYEFFLTAAPLRFSGAVGSPINPIAIK